MLDVKSPGKTVKIKETVHLQTKFKPTKDNYNHTPAVSIKYM